VKRAVTFLVSLVLPVALAFGGPAEKRAAPHGPSGVFRTEVPEHSLDVVLARPTATSVTISLLSYADAKAHVVYGIGRDALATRTRTIELKKGVPREVVLTGLKPGTRYYYQLRDADGRALSESEEICTFHTQRAAGTPFVFTVQADSHLDGNTSPELYRRTLASALADGPDFHIDLGDTFMTDKHPSRESAARQYLAQRYYLGLVGRSSPIFFVLGNHDGEDSRLLRGADSLAVWSNRTRKRYFPNPVPNGFYTGNGTKDPLAGVLQDYYAWQWGDALFVVLDPFWFAEKQRGRNDNWSRTLGPEQYRWLRHTLASSRAKFKFVFIHHLVGGADDQARGGAEAAPYYEWGGKNADGSEGFAAHRPGWPTPIHRLLVENRVSIVFHGHDHLYAKQDLDGIVYQTVPQPADPRGDTQRATEYGYRSGVILGSSGYMRVSVSPEKVTADYVRVGGARRENDERQDRQVAHSCTIKSGDGDK
jgi:predicted phosphodiesterase